MIIDLFCFFVAQKAGALRVCRPGWKNFLGQAEVYGKNTILHIPHPMPFL